MWLPVISLPPFFWQYQSLPSCSTSSKRGSSVKNCFSFRAHLRKEVPSKNCSLLFSDSYYSLLHAVTCVQLRILLWHYLLQGSRWIRSEPFLSANVSTFFHAQLFIIRNTFVYGLWRVYILVCWVAKHISLTLRKVKKNTRTCFLLLLNRNVLNSSVSSNF